MTTIIRENIPESKDKATSVGKTPTFDKNAVLQMKQKHEEVEQETNEHRIENRLKQIKYGKNTIGYDNYLATIPREKRRKIPTHPQTPDPYEQISKRMFDGKIKAWRRALHLWDNSEVRPDHDPTLKPPPSKGTKRKLDAESDHQDGTQNQKKKPGQVDDETLLLQKKIQEIQQLQEGQETKPSLTNGEEVMDDYYSDVPVDYEEDDDVL